LELKADEGSGEKAQATGLSLWAPWGSHIAGGRTWSWALSEPQLAIGKMQVAQPVCNSLLLTEQNMAAEQVK
jgi:hypothetical protein